MDGQAVTSFGYRFPTTPRQHQVEDLERSWLKPAWARFHMMRTGKGVLTCYEMDAMVRAGIASRFLVVCPKRVISTWIEMIYAHAATNFLLTTSTPTPNTPPQICIVNYERVWETVNGKRIANRALVDWMPEFIVVDEAHKIKNRTSIRSKAMHTLGRLAKFRRALTGTPDPTSWADYYSIYKFLDPFIFGTWTQFAAEYLNLDWWGNVSSYRNVEALAAKVHSIGSRVTRAQCFDLPEVEDRTVAIQLPPKARRVYKEMAAKLRATLDSGQKVTAPIVLTKLLRLAQITGGRVTGDDGEMRMVHTAKMSALTDLLEEVLADDGAKVVVFFRFRHELAEAVIAINHSPVLRPHDVLQLHGDTGDDGPVRERFANDPKARILLAQINTGSLGLDLSAAETAIFYSYDFDAATYQQARDRIWKPGHKITLIHLAIENSIDETILKVISGKIDRSTLLLDRWSELVGRLAA